MNATNTFTATGTKSTKAVKLDEAVFSVEIKNHDLLSQAYNSYLANKRLGNATTLTRGLVRGGGKKPWKQKGTGRARFGSSRTPIWRTGGIVFGPTGHENYTINLHPKAKKLALKQALTLKAADSKIHVIEDIKLKDSKTSGFVKLLEKLGLERNVLIVTDIISKELELATRNLGNIRIVKSSSVVVFDVLNADNILMTSKGLEKLNERLGA